jgi:hypothetical protein
VRHLRAVRANASRTLGFHRAPEHSIQPALAVEEICHHSRLHIITAFDQE